MNKVVVIVEPNNGGFSTYVPELPITCSDGDTWDEVESNIKDAIKLHLEGIIEDNLEIPEVFRSDYELFFQLSLANLFHLFPPLKQSTIAQLAGMNPSLLRQYTRGIKHPSLEQTRRIEQAVHQLGRELLNVKLV